VSDRAAAPALTYVLAIGITAILVSGLLISSSGLVEDRQRETVREELEIIGERIAASIAALDAASDSGGTVTRRIEVPTTVLDTGYYIDIVNCDGADTCLELRAADPMGVVVTVPVENRSVVTVGRPDPRSVTLVAAAGTDPPAGADADVSIAPSIGVASGVEPGFSSGGAVLGSSQALVVPGFDYGPSPPAVTEQITFTADVGGTGAGNLTYRWDFDGDGTPDVIGNESTAETTTHTYSTPGRYPVELTVEDASGANDSVTRLLRVSGLVFENDKQVIDPDGNGESAGIRFDIQNNFATEDVTITEVFVDPADPDIDELNNGGGDEVRIDGVGVYDVSGGLRIEDTGSIADFDSESTVESNELVTVDIGEFYGSNGQFGMTNQNVTVGFRYEIEGTKRNYVSAFDINAGGGGGGGGGVVGDPPVIEQAVPYTSDGDLYAYLELSDDDGDLDSVTVEVLDDDGDVIGTRSADLSAYGDDADGFLPLGDYDGDADAIRVTLRDEDGNDDTATESVS
jgi:PKD repeat protein